MAVLIGLSSYLVVVSRIPLLFPSPTARRVTDWQLYASEEYGFSFRYPPSAALSEGKSIGVDGATSDVAGLVQLWLPDGCDPHSPGGARLTIAVSTDPADPIRFGDPNIFSPDIPKSTIRLSGLPAVAATGTLLGPYGSDQIGLVRGGWYYLITGEPCFTPTAKQVIATFSLRR